MASVLQVTTIKDQGGNNTGITVADTTANVTIGNLTATSLAGGTIASAVNFPTKVTDRTILYMATRNGTHPTSYDDYRITANIASNTMRMSGVAPDGFTDIVSAHFITLDGQSGSSNQLSFQWMMAGSGQPYYTHSMSSTQIFNGAYTSNNLRLTSFLGYGSSGSRFEDLIAAGDVFGLRLDATGNQNVYGIGAKITWRF